MLVLDGTPFAQEFFGRIGEGSRDEGFFDGAIPNVPSRNIDTLGCKGESNRMRNFFPIGGVRSEFVPGESNASSDAAKR